MTPERWQKIESVFREAVRLDGVKRVSYLEEACRGDADLRAEVDSLLASDGSGGPLDGSALDVFDTEAIVSAVGAWGDGAKPVAPVPTLIEHGAPAGSDRTIGLSQVAGMDPVVGWLVCVKGPDQGRDYRIRNERNRIGRDSLMDICVAGDNRISRDTHATITYDPRHNLFRLSPGQARGIVYLNGRLLDAPSTLSAYDMIELGETGLQFVPFCGECFQWK